MHVSVWEFCFGEVSQTCVLALDATLVRFIENSLYIAIKLCVYSTSHICLKCPTLMTNEVVSVACCDISLFLTASFWSAWMLVTFGLKVFAEYVMVFGWIVKPFQEHSTVSAHQGLWSLSAGSPCDGFYHCRSRNAHVILAISVAAVGQDIKITQKTNFWCLTRCPRKKIISQNGCPRPLFVDCFSKFWRWFL